MSNNLAYVGTLRKNKTCVPGEFAENRRREINSSLFGFNNDENNDTSIISYVPKKNKSVLLLSTVHYNMQTAGIQKKPEVIHFYNKYKSGVDSMDQMLGTYSCKRRTQRWPYAFFFNILDIAALATHIIFQTFHSPKKKYARRTNLHLLSKDLVQKEIDRRINNKSIMAQTITKNAITDMMGGSLAMPKTVVASTSSLSGPAAVKGCCKKCFHDSKIYRKTRRSCFKCSQPVCAPHSIVQHVCKHCE